MAVKIGEKPSLPPGMIAQIEPDFLVACGLGYLHLQVEQPSGKREMGASEFLRGHRLLPGNLFASPQTSSSSQT